MIPALLVLGAMLALLAVLWGWVSPLNAVLKEPPQSASWEPEVRIEAFRALTDPKEEAYLRSTLPGDEFRRRQRERIGLARECVKSISRGALIFVRVGQEARSSSDPEVARAGQELVSLALETRLNALIAQGYLWLKWILPTMTPCMLLKFRAYEEGLRHIERLLGRKQASNPDSCANP
jgi:hypothetical protein